MKRKASKYFTCLCYAFLVVNALQAQSAGAIIDKHIATIGGEERLNKIQTLSLSLSSRQQSILRHMVLKIFHTRGIYIEQTILGDKTIQIVNRDQAWQKGPADDKAVEVSRDQLKTILENMNLLRTFPPLLLTNRALKAQGVLIRKPKLVRIATGKCYVLESKPNRFSTITYFIDHQNYKLLRRTTTLVQGKFSIKETADYQNFQWVAQVLVPFSINYTFRSTRFASQLKQEVKIEHVELNPVLEDSLFIVKN